MPINPDIITATLDEILACTCSALEDGICDGDGSLCGCPCRKFISAGPPTAENCCVDGQLTVHLEDIYQYEKFPSRTSAPSTCATLLAMGVVVTLFRCYPTSNEDSGPPSPSDLIAATESLYRDLYLITKGVICCLTPRKKSREFVFNGGRVLPPSGGCVGVEAKFAIQLN